MKSLSTTHKKIRKDGKVNRPLFRRGLVPEKSEEAWAYRICEATQDQQMQAWAASVIFWDTVGGRACDQCGDERPKTPLTRLMDQYQHGVPMSDSELERVLRLAGYGKELASLRCQEKSNDVFFETRKKPKVHRNGGRSSSGMRFKSGMEDVSRTVKEAKKPDAYGLRNIGGFRAWPPL
ncbi:MAG: hypothetical protein AAF571_03385 [Verrucomicrobiota bacterium]